MLHRTFRTLAVVVLPVALVVTLAVGRAAADENKCTVATKGDSPVAKACAEGGRQAAKKKMKELTKAAKAKGLEFKCDGCHSDMDTYELDKKAGDNFKKLLEAAK